MTEYIFGTAVIDGQETEVLKVIGGEQLHGSFETVREYSDSTITDNCMIVRLLNAKTDSEGKTYHWYEVKNHYRQIDKTKALYDAQADTDALCVEQEYRLTLVELGLNEGGNENAL